MKKQNRNIKKIIKKRIEIKQKNKIMGVRDAVRMNKTKPIIVGLCTRLDIRLGLDIKPFVVNTSSYLINSYRTIFSKPIKQQNDIKVLFLISNYEREKMLKQLIGEIKGFNSDNVIADYIIYDDNSSYKIDNNVVVNETHRGKEKYWMTFNEMFKYCKKNIYDVYIFTPNDFIKYDFERILDYGIRLKDQSYVFNIINDGRETSWNSTEPIGLNDDVRLQFFTDCGFFTNYRTLKLLLFKVNEIPIRKKNLKLGSQVGSQLTNRLNKLIVPIFTPIKSIAYHGQHKSLMNPESRRINKLISQ